MSLLDGVVAVEGDDRRTRDFILQLCDGLLHDPWSAVPAITVVGFGADLGWHPGIRQLPNLDDAVWNHGDAPPDGSGPGDLPTLATGGETVAGTAVLNVNRRRALDARPRHFLFVAQPLSEVDLDRLEELMLDPYAGWGVWVLGPVSSARWRVVIDRWGQLEFPALGLTATTCPSSRPAHVGQAAVPSSAPG